MSFSKRYEWGCVALLLAAFLPVSVAVGGAPSSGGIPSGVGGITGPTIVDAELNPSNDQYEFNLDADIFIDPSAPGWEKQFVIPGGITIVPGQAFPIWEEISILPDPTGIAPTDWHEQIHGATFNTPFVWGPGGHLVIHSPNGDETVPGEVSPDGLFIDFAPIKSADFPPTGGPIDMWIHKELVYNGVNVLTPGQPITVTVWEHPTVPEPASIALVGLALAALPAKLRRK